MALVKMKLGEILLNANLVTESQLKRRSRSRRRPKSLSA
jgi:hypothetical protein